MLASSSTMFRLLTRAILLAPLLLPLSASGAEVLTSRAGPASESGVYEMEARAIINARPAALRYIISNLCRYKDEMSHLAYCRVFKVQDNKAWSYALIDAPVIDRRDYVIVSEVKQDLQPDGSGMYISEWRLDPAEGPRPRDGIIRIGFNEGSWTLKAIDGGKRTEVVYRIKCAPGGNIPSRAAGYVQRVTLPDYVEMLERLANTEDRRNAVPPVKNEAPWFGVDVAPLDNPLPARGEKRLPAPPLLPR